MSPIDISSQKSSEPSTEESAFDLNIKPKTIYERIYSIYSRDYEYKIHNFISLHGGFEQEKLRTSLKISKKEDLDDGFYKLYLDQLSEKHSFVVWEKERSEGCIAGVVTECFEPVDFDLSFLKLLLVTSKIDYGPRTNDYYSKFTEAITQEFSNILKNTTFSDKWDSAGETYFKKKVDFFTSRGLKVEAVLPAFPCKSSNFNKVATFKPDKGEQLAIERLIYFATRLKRIYQPGITIWIVSDGHVFSDCIGVNDEVVDDYSKELRSLYKKLNNTGDDIIRFCSLKDIFAFQMFDFKASSVKDSELVNLLGTKVEEESDICRKLLVWSCDTDVGQLAKDINTENHPRLFLFRGFARFMEEDLVGFKIENNLSKKKYKKMISKIAFEMIKRNDAYSNLVELMFPFHLRLSIHAHDNAGPKFGVKLLASHNCKVIKSLEESNLPDFSDLLHIPTPWHNCVLKIPGKDFFFVTKSEVVKKALRAGSHIGEWNKSEGYFNISINNE